ncbi:pitrilysin family protein [Octadecabacter sp. 1_MG-2023]|uniref:M16 family metallopeptidase n=1 Tax=unclassified Octadecabacter TaxID=196158 RepID=UPI001C08B047|nr:MULTISPECIES: pitrilysin family protein [unclassified Octadecabacter]MBU2992102.1 insulinase family protein [Octadecabacter sp. B2R22]MDO6735141.1 pitrilysin family protein [Octadecabacter sp. 1_MG-2023]
MIRYVLAFALSLTAASAQAEIDIQEITSPGGIDAWLVEEDSIPFVAIEIIFDGGASLDDPAKRGATNLMMALLEEGSGDLDARGFQEAREALAASYGFSAYDDSVSVSAVFLTENRDEAAALLRDALVDPRFDDDAIERVRAQVQSMLRSDAQDPNSIASATFDAAAFGDHPYGSSLDGTAETVAAITRDDLIAAHTNALVQGRVYVGAAGDISADELGVLIDDLIGDLPMEGPDLPDRVEFGLEGGTTVVPYDTPQSVALFGHEGIERDDENFFAAYLLNEILGGSGLESRLMHEVREKRGLTYGVYSYLVPKDLSTMYLGQVASGNATIAEAIEVVRAEWAKMASEGVTAQELDAAKTYLTGAYPLRFDGNAEIAGILVGMQAQDLPTEYIAGRNDLVNAVTLEEVNQMAAELLDPDGLHFVVVGQPEGLE